MAEEQCAYAAPGAGVEEKEEDMARKTVIVGGVAGGATTAARLRRLDEDREILVLERGDYISYANCGLPYYVGEVIRERDGLLLQSPELMRQRFNIEVRVRHEVLSLDPQAKRIQVKNLTDGQMYEESYDDLVLATGSSPLLPPIPGIEHKAIMRLWTVPDTDAIKAAVDRLCSSRREGESAPRAVVIGGGFIGLEMAENLHARGLEVALVEMQNQVMAPLDPEMAAILHRHMEDQGVELHLGDGTSSFADKDGAVEVCLQSGKRLVADLVILALGVRPNSELAKAAGLELNIRGGIVVDKAFRTSQPDIYAVGDVIEVDMPLTGARTMIPLAGPANKQARILADNLAGLPAKEYVGTYGTAVAKVFDWTAASTGLNEKQLLAMGREKGRDFHSLCLLQKSHAGYYPAPGVMLLKLLFGPSGEIFGGQIVGQEGADKRIDTLATVMSMGGNVHQLARLELAYAPPYSSAKDPVNMLGFAAENVLDGKVDFVTWQEIRAQEALPEEQRGYYVLDVTEEGERQAFAYPGSYHIPLGELRQRLDELPKDKPLAVYCAVGIRANTACRILRQRGFADAAILAGGNSLYKLSFPQDEGQEVKKN